MSLNIGQKGDQYPQGAWGFCPDHYRDAFQGIHKMGIAGKHYRLAGGILSHVKMAPEFCFSRQYRIVDFCPIWGTCFGYCFINRELPVRKSRPVQFCRFPAV